MRRDTGVTEVVEEAATVTNERSGEERHGGGRGCGGDGHRTSRRRRIRAADHNGE